MLIPGILCICGILFFVLQPDEPSQPLALVDTIANEPATVEIDSEQPLVTEPVPTSVLVDVKGAVKHPGVYTFTTEQRIVDAIEMAGGYQDGADPTLINHAQKLQDEMVIYVPKEGEEPIEIAQAPAATGATSSNASAKVNLNGADESLLTTLPGIGPAKAQAILAYRAEVGQFQSIEDLKNVSGIGDKSFEKLKDLIDIK